MQTEQPKSQFRDLQAAPFVFQGCVRCLRLTHRGCRPSTSSRSIRAFIHLAETVWGVTIIDVIAYLSASISGIFGLLQIERTVRTRTTEGVSKLSWAAMGTNAGFWIAYGLRTDSPQQLVGNVPWLVMTLVVGWFLAKDHRLSRSVGLGWPVSMLLLGVAVMSVNTVVLGPLSIGRGLLVTIPQLRAAQRSEHAVGVSGWAWAASSTAGIGWIVYGLASNDVPVIIAGIPGFALNTAVTVVAMMRHRRAVASAPQLDHT